MAAWLIKQREALKRKGAWYWIRAAVIIGLGVWAGERLSESDLWLNKRRQTYRWLHSLNPRPTHPRWVRIILIEDDEYWLGELGGRKPIHRDYLAKLIRATANADPELIAIDFDLRSPSPDGNPREHPAYQEETTKFCDAVRETARRCPIIVPKTLALRNGSYTTDSDIYDGYDFGNARVLKGYIGLPNDERLVPAVPLPLNGGGTLDSFARAIVRARSPEILKQEEDSKLALPYADFIDLQSFTTVSAHDVLLGDQASLDKLAHKPVIIGAHWHSRAANRGALIDLHGSPNGDMSGVALHANYVEAMLDSRVHWGWNPLAVHLVEGMGAMLVALIFALNIGPIVKASAVCGMCLFLVGLSIFSLLVLGLVFDFFVPVISALGHGFVERALEWRDTALKHPD
jgi:CHASE2 domain-containing sensor protein